MRNFRKNITTYALKIFVFIKYNEKAVDCKNIFLIYSIEEYLFVEKKSFDIIR